MPRELPEKRITVLRRHMAAGEWRAALKMAAGFGRLEDEKEAIARAWEACARPEFYRAIGRDPDALIANGIETLKRKYGSRK